MVRGNIAARFGAHGKTFIVYMFRAMMHKTVWGIIYFKIFSLFGMAVAMLSMGSMEGFITFALIGLLTWFVYWLWTDELSVVASMLCGQFSSVEG